MVVLPGVFVLLAVCVVCGLLLGLVNSVVMVIKTLISLFCCCVVCVFYGCVLVCIVWFGILFKCFGFALFWFGICLCDVVCGLFGLGISVFVADCCLLLFCDWRLFVLCFCCFVLRVGRFWR